MGQFSYNPQAPIAKRLLARLFFPQGSEEAAARRLRRWIDETVGLRRKLYPQPSLLHRHVFAPWQVRLLIDTFGEPEEF